MLQINNNTPLEVALNQGLDHEGNDYAVVVIKGSYEIQAYQGHAQLRFASEQMPIFEASEYYGEPTDSSIRYESDMALYKPATDVLLLGHAYAPEGQAVSELDVSLSVGDQAARTMKVYGDRLWRQHQGSWYITRPEPFERMPLRYEYAYGGKDLRAQTPESAEYFADNPIGKGFVPDHAEPIEGQPLPNIEDPTQLIQHFDQRVQPLAWGVTSPHSQPRLAYAGTYDTAWQQTRMPLMPEDFNWRYFNAASAQLQFSPHLKGHERICMTHLCPPEYSREGSLEFFLPNHHMLVTSKLKSEEKLLAPKLDTVLIEPDEARLQLTWRAALPCKRQFLHLESVTVDWRRA